MQPILSTLDPAAHLVATQIEATFDKHSAGDLPAISGHGERIVPIATFDRKHLRPSG
ncbi:hypothetical protein MKL09_15480 [Methylobacterium sp. J-048]|uniref:hypothetical protein n=1 Tax=Methylobacterium sp. J-048 TaxID=2836635 RepID=UPI001FB8AF24|nr:hypothetical protein [Methylobacterium sp. J-048]MCJ2057955.1 hypothetical protein [Methylobacterium sp. J-048]